MGSKKPTVSVLMPFYDNGTTENRRLFSEALKGMLSQNFRGFEVVMAVSGEKDFARGLAAEDSRIKIYEFDQKISSKKSLPLKEKVYGIITARNLCLKKAKGIFVAYADYDDISFPGRLKKQVGFLKNHPDIGVLGSSMILEDEKGREVGRRAAPVTDAEVRRHLLQFNPVPQPTVMATNQPDERASHSRSESPRRA